MSHLTETERSYYTQTFLKVDLDGNGWLDMNELGRLCLSLGFDMSFSQLLEVFNRIDTDHNGRITLDEFLAVMPHATTEQERRVANLRRCFNDVDKDGDGYLTPEEVQLAMEKTGKKISMDHAIAMVKKLDINGDGKIDMQEFLAYYQ